MRRIFGSFNNYSLAKPYFESVGKVSDAVFYCMQYKRGGEWDAVAPVDRVQIIKMDKEYPGNTGKLNDWAKVEILGENEWCVFTDMHDVVFQTDIPKLSEDVFAMICYEGKRFGNVPFWREMFPEDMMDKKIYNCGVFAMKRSMFILYLKTIEEEYSRMKEWKKNMSMECFGDDFPFNSPHARRTLEHGMGSLFNGVADTYYFNKFINQIEFVGRVKEWRDVCCYNFLIEKKKAIVKDGKLCRRSGTLFAIAHYNGNAKEKI